ncbi:hypothetical protein Aph01nite_64100 [Acrocarpospora phusangensis]|uniref:SIS domain-containing protein n=1 Tax=Acrocarpospora phusangensis TaxID=1070424 RepID=A0A919UU56_9ACTN|nr:SIS domain-containing protein [Acrocarpospora phusangensis]GIH28100.1 hypothetical protein Aph01nite_64100 [Acrocarpospora phusangensis]
MVSHTQAEIESQPDIWTRTLEVPRGDLPRAGLNVLGVGCGTSYYILDAYARRREMLGRGRTRAWIATELADEDPYDMAILLSRSGTTSDLLPLAERLSERMTTIAITGTPDSPITRLTHRRVVLDFADEQSVVQTRFATAALTLLRASIGDDVTGLPAAAEQALREPLPDPADFDHVVFLGTGWTLGLADEAALKCREAAKLWTESYAALEYRHGPIACAGPRTLVWSFAPLPGDVTGAIAGTGATLRVAAADAQAELVMVQRLAVAFARHRGLNSDNPDHLTRSVIVDR